MEKNKWISDKIRKLEHENKGRSHAQNIAIAFSMYENRQQGGYSDPTKVFIEKSAAQLPIKNINYNVETTGIKEGNLPPGYYTRVDYNNGKSDYLRPEGLAELQRMNNYRLYMEAQAKKQQPKIQMGQTVAMPSYQFGGFSFPNIMNNYQPVPDLQNVFQSQMQSPGVQPTQTVAGNFTGAIPDLTQAAKTAQQIGYTDYIQGDNNGDGVVDAKDQVDSFGNPLKTPQYNDINRIQLANPYGGVSLENALYFGARGFGEGNVWKGALGSLTAGLKAARIGMSGYAAGKEQNRVQDYMRNQLYKPNTNYNYGQVGQNATYLFKEGGKVPTNAEMLTGAFITDQPNPNVKIEDAEFVKNSQTGQIQKAVGDKHEAKSGGIPVNLPPQSKILSDYTKIGAKNAKELKEKYDITLKASDTFAKAMDKVNKKIGITKLIQEEKEYSEKFEKQIKSSIDKKTKDVNLNFLAKELEEIEKEKLQLQPIQDQAFEEIFRLQEAIPKRGDGKTLLKQEGGYAPSVIEYSKKYGITPQRVMELMQEGGEAKDEKIEGENESAEAESTNIEQIEGQVEEALKQGADPNQLLQQLVQIGVPQEQATQMIQELMQEIQFGENQSEMKCGGKVKMQEGGMAQPDPNQIIEAFAQLTQQDPQQIAAQLQEMQPEEQQQVLQQMVKTLQQEQPQQMMREGGYSLPMYQTAGTTTEPLYNTIEGLNEYRKAIREKQSAVKGKAYGISDPQVALQELYNNFPDLVTKELGKNIEVDTKGNVKFKGGVDLAKQQKVIENLQKGMDSRMRDSASVIINNPTLFSPEKVKEAQRYLNEETFLAKAPGAEDPANSVRGFDQKLGNFTSGRYSLGLNLLTPEDLKKVNEAGIKTLKQLKGSKLYDGLDTKSKERVDKINTLVGKTNADYLITEFPLKKEETVKDNVTVGQQDSQVKNRIVDKTMMANLPINFNLPPSSLQGVYKPEVNLSRMDPYKLSAEPYLANIESQRQAATENNYNLSDIQRAAYNANMLAASQMAANDAIGKVAQANTAAQFQTDMYNAQQADKEQLTNLGLAQQYENKMYGAINATDTDLRKYFAQNNAENRQRFMDIANLNMINAVTPNYQSTGSDVIFNNAPKNIGIPQVDPRIMKAFEDTKDDPVARAQVMKLLNLA